MSALEDLEAGLPPEQLVPGDIDAIERASAECRTIADKLAETRRNVEYIELHDSDWTGGAAAVYFAVKSADVGVLDVSAQAMDVASRALADYAVMLRDARRRAAEALEEYRTGKAAAAAAGPPTPVLPGSPAVPPPGAPTWTWATDRRPSAGPTWQATPVYDPLDPTIVPSPPTPTQPYQEGPVAKLTAARDDVTRSGTAAADSLHRTREVAPASSSGATTQSVSATPWQTLETGVVTLETTAAETTAAETVATSPATTVEAFAAGAAGEDSAQGALPGGGSAGALTLLSVLALFGGAGAVAARAARLPGPAALASSMPPGAFGERLASLGERTGGGLGAPVGQGGLGSALRGAGGRTASGRPGGGLGGVGGASGRGRRGRGRGPRGLSGWLDEADLDTDLDADLDADGGDETTDTGRGPTEPGAAGGR